MNSANANGKMLDKATQETKTMVLWDINTCPVPDGYDSTMVRQCIEWALKKAGHSGPLTITAIGYLNQTLKRAPDVLPAIYSTGVLLKNVTHDFRSLYDDLTSWPRDNRAPATLMLISGPDAYSGSIIADLSRLQLKGYITLLAHPQQAHFPFDSSRKLLWERLLKDAMDSGEIRRQDRQENCCETGDGSAWLCSICSNSCLTEEQNLPRPQHAEFHTLKGGHSFEGKSFKDFTMHLKSRNHALCELSWVSRPITSRVIKLWKGLYSINIPTLVDKQSQERDDDESDDDEWERLTV